MLDNPCLTLSSNESWSADYTNARCERVYLEDSGWKYIYDNQTSLGIVDNYGYTYVCVGHILLGIKVI